MKKPREEADAAALVGLVAETLLTLTPAQGGFDAAAVAAAVEGPGPHFRDPVDPAIYVVSANAEMLATFEARRKANAEAMLPPALRIAVEPGRVVVGRSAFGPDEPMARAFLAWITGAYRCRIVNDEGTDVTPQG
jgi:hypothetical protein